MDACCPSRKRLAPMATALLLATCAAAQAQVQHAAMRARTDTELARLRIIAEQESTVQQHIELPEPLRRYMAYTRAASRPPARRASWRFQGEVRLPQTEDRNGVEQATPWMAMTGRQTMALSRGGIGYVWDTRWTNPRFAVDVRDRCIDADTHIWAIRDDGRTLLDEGHARMAATYLIRFFAEATQSPTMLLPSAHLRWTAIDTARARAHMRDGEVSATMVCHFDADGALTRCESEDRELRFSGEVAERWVRAPWVMTRSDYVEMDGLRLPTRMSVRWLLPGGEFEQVRATIDAVRFDRPQDR